MIDAKFEKLQTPYSASPTRYDTMTWQRCGQSGLRLPSLTLGLWHNFGSHKPYAECRSMLRSAFDHGVTHFDLANNYGPPYGSAEETFGRIMASDLRPYRDELIISSKAGYDMWPGPYGIGGTRKYLIASLDQSLKRMGLEYVDIFYHHRPDPDTPLEETMSALDQIVRSGKALYAGVSNYKSAELKKAAAILKDLGTPCLIDQVSCSILNRWTEDDHLLETAAGNGIGVIVFSPLQRGLLTDRYLNGIPADSRAALNDALKSSVINAQTQEYTRQLNAIALERGQTLSQMALSWVLHDPRVTSAIFGASSVEQLETNLSALEKRDFSPEELQRIDMAAVPFIRYLQE